MPAPLSTAVTGCPSAASGPAIRPGPLPRSRTVAPGAIDAWISSGSPVAGRRR